MLEAVTEAVVDMHERYHHRTPLSAKTVPLGDDLLAYVLGGIYTDVEKTLIEMQQAPAVQEVRRVFRTAMQNKLIEQVEAISGRRVVNFIPTTHVGPDLEIGLFFLESAADPE